MYGKHFDKKFPELNMEFVDFALENADNSTHAVSVLQCHNKRYAPSEKFGAKCGCTFIYNPRKLVVAHKCDRNVHGKPNGTCGMWDVIPVMPTCPDCHSTNVRWLESEDSGVEEAELYHMTMTGRQSMVGKSSDNGDYDPIFDVEQELEDEDQEPHIVLHEDSDKTLEPRFPDYALGIPYYEPDDEIDSETSVKMNTSSKQSLFDCVWAPRQFMTAQQVNGCKANFGFTPHPTLNRNQVSKCMKKMYYSYNEAYNLLSEKPFPGRMKLIEDHLDDAAMWETRLRTGHMCAGYDRKQDLGIELNAELEKKGRELNRKFPTKKMDKKTPYRKTYPDISWNEWFMEMYIEDNMLGRSRIGPDTSYSIFKKVRDIQTKLQNETNYDNPLNEHYQQMSQEVGDIEGVHL